MKKVEKRDKLEKLLSDLQYALDNGAVIVVEGPNDEKALRSLQITGPVNQLSRKTFSELAEELAVNYSNVIILTDFDSYGKKAAKDLRDFFSNECLKPDLLFRERFHKLLSYVEFEDVPTLFENEMNK